MGLKLKDYFVFDGESSADFGFFASGENAYNSPEKDYEVYEVPGRNGDVMIDNNRFKNVTVKYPCYYEKTGGNLTKDISDFRNMLLSKSGYKRLYDTHNPDEYRLAVCRNVIETDPTEYDLLGAVEIEFDCKPQRYLVSGETPVPITSGQKLMNQTFFDANPLIIITADNDGAVYVNERPIIFQPDKIGDIELDNTKPTARTSKSSGSWSSSATSEWTEDHYHTGDAVRASADIQLTFTATYPGLSDHLHDAGERITINNATINRANQSVTFVLGIQKNALKFTAGTSKTVSFQFSTIIEYETDPGSGVLQGALTLNGTVVYDGNKTITINASGTVPSDATSIAYALESVPSFIVDSSVSAFENEVYFDSESCDAYTYDNDGKRISINQQISVGAGFPVLKPGENGISFFGGIQTCSVVPRWWKI